MAQNRHAKEYAIGHFCARVPCDHTDYIKVCDPKWDIDSRTGDWKFAQNAKGGPKPKSYEAHHIVCWSPVKSIFFGDTVIEQIIKGTHWCVNNKSNMIGLPMWGHTVKWYNSRDDVPPFTALPQHNVDHNTKGTGYTAEVRDALKELIDEIKEVIATKHDVPPPKDIEEELKFCSEHFETVLLERGSRPPGTHLAFTAAQLDLFWYMPFSMASTATPRRFLERTKETLNAIEAAQRAMMSAAEG